MENHSFLLKLSKSKLAFIVIVSVIISSSFAGNYVVNNYILLEYGPDYIIEAIELDEKPVIFFPFSKLESYGIQTIFNSSAGVEISFKVFTEIQKLIRSHETYNVEYGSNYYRLEFNLVGDKVPPIIPLPLIILSFIISLILLISVILITIIIIVNILKILGRAFPSG